MPWNAVMDKWKAGSLRSGGTGQPVQNQKQAVAIMLSEKRKADQGDEEYKPKSGSLRGFGRRAYVESRSANY